MKDNATKAGDYVRICLDAGEGGAAEARLSNFEYRVARVYKNGYIKCFGWLIYGRNAPVRSWVRATGQDSITKIQ